MDRRLSRWTVVKAVFWRPGVRVVSSLYGIWGFLDLVATNVIPKLSAESQAIWNRFYVLPSLSWQMWLVVGMAIMTLAALEGAYRFANQHVMPSPVEMERRKVVAEFWNASNDSQREALRHIRVIASTEVELQAYLSSKQLPWDPTLRLHLEKVINHSYTTGKIFISPEYESAFDEIIFRKS